jgi:hypothetical protein
LNDPNWLRGNSIAYDSDGGAVIVVTVFTESSKVRLDRQSVVRLLNKMTQTAVWETTTDRSEAVFGSVQYGGYEIEVSAVGFLTANSELEVGSSQGPFEINVVLERDPAAVNLNVADDAMPSRARKNTSRAVAALRSGNLKAAQKRLGEAYKLVPSRIMKRHEMKLSSASGRLQPEDRAATSIQHRPQPLAPEPSLLF